MGAILPDETSDESKLLLKGEGVTDPLNYAKLTWLVDAQSVCFQAIYVTLADRNRPLCSTVDNRSCVP